MTCDVAQAHASVLCSRAQNRCTHGLGLRSFCGSWKGFWLSIAFDYVFSSTEGQRAETEYKPDNFIGVTEGRRK